ncbi:hypothetical protein Fmac_021942 [Flemingia macrophylla]|uniref:Uncharacterized protein n=1 Tax=Flemingia macrophylla TaxID=520843 RepID=A0ABD1LYA6_9FABA
MKNAAEQNRIFGFFSTKKKRNCPSLLPKEIGLSLLQISLFNETLDVNGVLVLDLVVNGPTWENFCRNVNKRGNNDIPEPSSPLAKKRRKGTMKGKQPKYVIKLPPLKKAPVVESPLIQPSPSKLKILFPFLPNH